MNILGEPCISIDILDDAEAGGAVSLRSETLWGASGFLSAIPSKSLELAKSGLEYRSRSGDSARALLGGFPDASDRSRTGTVLRNDRVSGDVPGPRPFYFRIPQSYTTTENHVRCRAESSTPST